MSRAPSKTSLIRFPKDFLWGAATSSYQIEGAPATDGKTQSIWDTFCRSAGKIKDGSSGDRACEHFVRYRDDVALMKSLGLGAYRFSISWPRVMPGGKGQLDDRGIDFYSRLVDELLEAGITPFVTLYHWDLPQELQDRGGWTNRDIADWFGEYAGAVGRALGDRAKHWITLNEPQIFSFLGYLTGEHAPGLVDFNGYGKASHHINLAHGSAVQALRSEAQQSTIGTTLQNPPVHPRSDSDEDRQAALRFDSVFNRWYLDPVLLGRYPELALELLAPLQIPILDGDLTRIHQPIDFLGINHYSRFFIYADDSIPLLRAMMDTSHHAPGARHDDFGWDLYPDGLHEVLTMLRTEYANPVVYITENGCALHEEFRDQYRVDYLDAYLRAAHRAIDDGSRLAGYFVWSLMDNFEWAHGYTMRFGIVHVDFETQKRTLKTSADWYRDTVLRNGLV